MRAAREAVGGYLASALVVEADGQRLVAAVGPLEPRDAAAPPITRVVQALTFQTPGPIRELRLTVRLFADATSSHQALLRVHGQGGVRQLVRRGPFALALDADHLTPSTLSLVREYLGWASTTSSWATTTSPFSWRCCSRSPACASCS